MNPYNCHQNLDKSFSLVPKGQIQNIVSLSKFPCLLSFITIIISWSCSIESSFWSWYWTCKAKKKKVQKQNVGRKNGSSIMFSKKCGLQNCHGLRLWYGVIGNWLWFVAKCVVKLKVGKKIWCLSLIVCKNMQVGKNARLHALYVLWVKNPCQQKTNMWKVSVYGLVGVKTLLLNWFVLVKLL